MEGSLIQWDYQKSVEKVRNLTFRWKNLSVDIVRELFKAREALSAPGSRTDLVANATRSWANYVQDVGIDRSTVHRWLERYIPSEDKLLTTEEYQERKQIEYRQKVDRATAIRGMVIERIKTKRIPKDWDDEAEKAYQQHLVEEKERKERVRKLKEEMERETAEKEKKKAEWDDLNRKTSANSKALNEAATMFIEQHRQRSEFKEKIRLSESGRTAPFIDAIMDYLDCLENDDRRIEACNNIVKVCRTIAVQLHQKSMGKAQRRTS